ncbi:type IV pilin protein [Rhodanobacter lindaniclasticus]
MTRHMRGFTLLELMIVVVIIAVLAAVAIPTYGRYAFRAHRADGQELLLRVANAQERYYSTANAYGGLTDVGFSNPAISEKGFYSVTVVASSSSQAFVATAAPVGGQANDVCGSLTIDNAGVKTPGPASASSNSNGSCW